MIDKIELEVDAPAEGKPADFSIQSQESDPYTVNVVYWSKCADEGDENTLVSMSVDDSFEKGWYRLVLYVYMDFNYAATEAVSYTHLGTEKAGVCQRHSADRYFYFCLFRGGISVCQYDFSVGDGRENCHCPAPVSYTHLDVYKRQEKELCRSSLCQ